MTTSMSHTHRFNVERALFQKRFKRPNLRGRQPLLSSGHHAPAAMYGRRWLSGKPRAKATATCGREFDADDIGERRGDLVRDDARQRIIGVSRRKPRLIRDRSDAPWTDCG